MPPTITPIQQGRPARRAALVTLPVVSRGCTRDVRILVYATHNGQPVDLDLPGAILAVGRARYVETNRSASIDVWARATSAALEIVRAELTRGDGFER